MGVGGVVVAAHLGALSVFPPVRVRLCLVRAWWWGLTPFVPCSFLFSRCVRRCVRPARVRPARVFVEVSMSRCLDPLEAEEVGPASSAFLRASLIARLGAGPKPWRLHGGQGGASGFEKGKCFPRLIRAS